MPYYNAPHFMHTAGSSLVHTIHQLPLLIEPALGRILSALQHNVVALQAARQVVPRRRYHGVLAL